MYTMHFVSQTSRKEDSLRTTGSSTGCVISAAVLTSGIRSDFKGSDGELALPESELRADEFEETGEIGFGDVNEHVLWFRTVGQGYMIPELETGVMAATASWKGECGKGRFTNAQGFITSNFTISHSGSRSDFHCGLIFLQE